MESHNKTPDTILAFFLLWWSWLLTETSALCSVKLSPAWWLLSQIMLWPLGHILIWEKHNCQINQSCATYGEISHLASIWRSWRLLWIISQRIGAMSLIQDASFAFQNRNFGKCGFQMPFLPGFIILDSFLFQTGTKPNKGVVKHIEETPSARIHVCCEVGKESGELKSRASL